MDRLLIGVASALGSALLTYVTTFLKIRQDLAAQYDAELRRDRIGVYKALWKCTEPLARYARQSVFTYHEAQALATALRCWYFEEGGIFLSEPARDAYFDLQKALKTLHGGAHEQVPDPVLEKLMEIGSALRTRLSQDVGTRVQALLQGRSRQKSADPAASTRP
jgi:hypothetical protein